MASTSLEDTLGALSLQTHSEEIEEKTDDEQFNYILELFPDADPAYMKNCYHRLQDDPALLEYFIAQHLKHKDYPKLKDFKRREMLSYQTKQYTTAFNVENFLETIPDPEKYFNNVTRSYGYEISKYVSDYIYTHFKNLFTCIRANTICEVLKENDYNVIKSFNQLNEKKYKKFSLKRVRSPITIELLLEQINIPLLQELAYVTHIDEITKCFSEKQAQKLYEFEFAKENQLLLQCVCCFDAEVLEKNMFTCIEGHGFCNECILKSVEIGIAENKTTIHCLTECKSEFTLATLQKILPPKLFSKLALRKQFEEVKAAGIEEVESCPFCDFVTIPAPDDKIFKCLNNECMRESCRSCHEPAHIPFHCDEIEKSDEMKARNYVENKMTEALLRKCWQCGLKFIKESGCNKMKCSCGALMCYVCEKPVKDYTHFNGEGGTKTHLCPLFSDANKLHLDKVRKVGEEAKHEIAQKNPNIALKFDPLSGLAEAYKKGTVHKPRRLTNERTMPYLRDDDDDHEYHHPDRTHYHLNCHHHPVCHLHQRERHHHQHECRHHRHHEHVRYHHHDLCTVHEDR